MNDSLLQTIVAVKEAGGNVTKAGLALGNISQSAVSQRLMSAKERYGAIFVEGSYRKALTPLGRRLYTVGRTLREIDDEIAAQKAERRYGAPDVRGEILRIGYSPSHLRLVASALSHVLKPKSGLKVCTVEINADAVKGMLNDGRIDIGVTYPPAERPKWLDEKRVGSLPLALIVNKEHKFARRSQIIPQDLRDEPLALLEPKTVIRTAIDRYFGRLKPRNVILEADTVTALLALATYGVATILPAFPQDEAFRAVPLAHPPVKTSLLWKKRVVRKQSAILFAEALEDAAGETLEAPASRP